MKIEIRRNIRSLIIWEVLRILSHCLHNYISLKVVKTSGSYIFKQTKLFRTFILMSRDCDSV